MIATRKIGLLSQKALTGKLQAMPCYVTENRTHKLIEYQPFTNLCRCLFFTAANNIRLGNIVQQDTYCTAPHARA